MESFLNSFFVERYADDTFAGNGVGWLNLDEVHQANMVFLGLNMIMYVWDLANKGFWHQMKYLTYHAFALTNLMLVTTMWAEWQEDESYNQLINFKAIALLLMQVA